jgi:hypothetical protein
MPRKAVDGVDEPKRLDRGPLEAVYLKRPITNRF